MKTIVVGFYEITEAQKWFYFNGDKVDVFEMKKPNQICENKSRPLYSLIVKMRTPDSINVSPAVVLMQSDIDKYEGEVCAFI